MEPPVFLTKEQYALLLEFKDKQPHSPSKSSTLDELKAREYIYPAGSKVAYENEYETCFEVVAWRISTKGEDALNVFDQQAEKTAQEKHSKRNDRIFQVLLAVLSFVLGIITECFSGFGESLITLITNQG